eukprot:45557-Pleurochrysis_carterae.AAC.1
MCTARCAVRRAKTSGRDKMEAWAASMKIGGLHCPRSAGCSRIYSEPALQAAERMAIVRRTSSLACASSHACAGSTSGKPSRCSRLLTAGGPPAGEEPERKGRDTEKVEHGGDATTAAYSPAAQR